MVVLPGYGCQLSAPGVQHSISKLSYTSSLYRPHLPPSLRPTEVPCSSEAETLGYRVSAGFQLVVEGGSLQYAMRDNYLPRVLNGDAFPVAVGGIQRCMRGVIGRLRGSDEGGAMRRGLTSCKFVSSWDKRTIRL
ncbi:hypothetical protein TrRE_jg4028, partial [Triparma retinervis]